jgi:hypothetical protein
MLIGPLLFVFNLFCFLEQYFCTGERREKREAQVCEEVRQAVIALHEQGLSPTHRNVRTLLSDPNLIRMPKAIATWHAVRCKLGYES